MRVARLVPLFALLVAAAPALEAQARAEAPDAIPLAAAIDSAERGDLVGADAHSLPAALVKLFNVTLDAREAITVVQYGRRGEVPLHRFARMAPTDVARVYLIPSYRSPQGRTTLILVRHERDLHRAPRSNR